MHHQNLHSPSSITSNNVKRLFQLLNSSRLSPQSYYYYESVSCEWENECVWIWIYSDILFFSCSSHVIHDFLLWDNGMLVNMSHYIINVYGWVSKYVLVYIIRYTSVVFHSIIRESIKKILINNLFIFTGSGIYNLSFHLLVPHLFLNL